MARTKWHILTEDGALTLARRLPVRFDLAVQTVLPRCGRRRLAMQIRQDMWRLLRDLRGFAPVVRVEYLPEGLRVIAGGQVGQAPFPKRASEEKLRQMLSDRNNRSRWLAHAGGFCYG
ncbi:hypothetical protein ACSSNL_02125 [Thalassobius sp. S69A]|uniref:hypothetical protein n=1 Tax=unclassified Thalassovita TaxID=2619711 RepID=UPI000C0DA12A|nr:hypothetical protein [Paracoccaceae bacterium]MBT26267.1 hypothetical protein [Paracoccaceae bacterium]